MRIVKIRFVMRTQGNDERSDSGINRAFLRPVGFAFSPPLTLEIMFREGKTRVYIRTYVYVSRVLTYARANDRIAS